MPRRIDFNCDLGEGCDDGAIMQYISSASIACGLHAGDADTMRRTIALCMQHGVAIGAHPSFDDREGFGRREMQCPVDEIHALVTRQIRMLSGIACELGTRIVHVKPHGALYNMAARDAGTGDAIASAVRDFDPTLILYGLSGSASTDAGTRIGLRVAHEVFAERRYEADGRLTPRSAPDAVIDDLDASLAQVRRLVRDGRVIARTGESIALRADTLCLHGDRTDAAQFARAVRGALRAESIDIAAPFASTPAAEIGT